MSPLIGCFNSDNSWKLIKATGSFNYILNPSAETTGNFTAVSAATITRSTTYQKYGLYSYRVQSTANGDGVELDTNTLSNVDHYVTVRVRGDYPTLQASLNGNTKTLTEIEQIDNDWKLFGVSFASNLANGATSVDILATGSGDFYVDGAQLEPLSYWTTYIDGTQKDCTWLGVPHASASERSSESRAGGQLIDFWEEYSFQIQRISGAGASTRDLSVDSFSILPGGELNSVKVNSREFTIVGKFIGLSEKDLHQKRRTLEIDLLESSNVGQQPFKIRFGGSDAQKEISGFYQSGLESDLAAFYGNIEIVENELYLTRNLFTENVSIQFLSPDPYWYEVGEKAIILNTNDSATFRSVAGRLRSTGQWDNLGPPSSISGSGQINAVVEDDTYIYWGGAFTNFDGIANADYIVRYNKQTEAYSSLGTGLNNIVWGLAIGADGTLYATGEFTTAGGGAANYIASWNGSSWSALGSGLNSLGLDLVIGLDGTLYVGGAFTTAGGGAANYIASWNGSSWSALGSGLGDTVSALAVGPDGIIYIGGNFTSAGGATGHNLITSWDGSSYTMLGVGIGGGIGSIEDIVVSSDNIVYVSGNFNSAGGETANDIVQWNGTAWSSLGLGGGPQFSLSIGVDNVLYLSGDFSTIGNLPTVEGLAKWNGSSYSQLDVDLPGDPIVFQVLASQLVVDPVINTKYDLYVGFNTSGTAVYNGAVDIENGGSAPAFPKIVFTRTGGASATIITLRNERTGQELLFDYSLLDGETLTINLSPTEKSIISSFFGPRLDAVLANSDFGTWSLLPGGNNTTSFVDETGSATVTAYMLWREPYNGYD